MKTIQDIQMQWDFFGALPIIQFYWKMKKPSWSGKDPNGTC